MRSLRVLSLVLASGCIGSIGGTGDDTTTGDDTPPTDPAKDLVVGFSHTTPLGVGQLGRHAIFDGCTTDALCATQEVQLVGATVDHTEVVSSTVMTGASKFDVHALAAGQAMVNVMAQNSGVAAMETQMVEVLVPDAADLIPTESFKAVHVPHTCAPPIGFQTSVVATFAYQLRTGTTLLKGSGFYPFTSAELTGVLPPDLGADGGLVKYAAGANATASTITSPLLLAEIPITLSETIDGVALGDQFKAPTAEMETLIFADGTSAGQPVCFDSTLRVGTSMTPTICTVVDTRDAASQWKGPGPYQLTWLAAGTCTVSFQISGVGAPVTRDYQPLP